MKYTKVIKLKNITIKKEKIITRKNNKQKGEANVSNQSRKKQISYLR